VQVQALRERENNAEGVDSSVLAGRAASVAAADLLAQRQWTQHTFQEQSAWFAVQVQVLRERENNVEVDSSVLAGRAASTAAADLLAQRQWTLCPQLITLGSIY